MNYTMLGKKLKKKKKKKELKPSLIKKKQPLHSTMEKIKTDENYCDNIKFCYSDLTAILK